MEIEDFIDVLRREGPLLLAASAEAGLDAAVPSCPEWDVRELVRHMAGVHHWAAQTVGERRTDEITGELVDIVGGWPPDDELLAWAAQKHEALVRVLEEADPSFDYWTWIPASTALTMWARRQAHETTIHRVDAELAAGSVSAIPVEVAADGVDEIVIGMLNGRRRPLSVDAPLTLHLVAADVPRAWSIVMRADGFDTDATLSGEADCTARAPAVDLYRTVWHRGGELTTEGDPNVLATYWDNVNPRWS